MNPLASQGMADALNSFRKTKKHLKKGWGRTGGKTFAPPCVIPSSLSLVVGMANAISTSGESITTVP